MIGRLLFPAAVLAALAASPSGAAERAAPWVPVKSIDFSSKHEVLIQNFDGTFNRMDEPYFLSRPMAPGTWQILADGDFMYLVEGDKEALLIDSGYGAGDIRAYAQTLTRKPLRYVANTHFHFDHTANNAYFDRAYMSQGTKDGLPAPSGAFAGVPFPRNYPIQVIGEGFKFQLGNRELETIMLGNHTDGGTAYLDRKRRILFAGDELMAQQGIPVRLSIERFAGLMEKLAAHRSEYDTVATGWQILDAVWVDRYLALAKYILAGHEGLPAATAPVPYPDRWRSPQPVKDPDGRTVYVRHVPRGGGGQAGAAPNENLVRMTYGGATITYDKRKVRE